MKVFARKNLIAAAAGVVLAGAPLVAFNIWVGGLIDRQAHEDISGSARRAMALAESRTIQTIDMLDRLAEAGVNSCSSADIEAMRRAVLVTAAVKGVAVMGPDGSPICTHLGEPSHRKVLASAPLPGAAGYQLEVIQLSDLARMVLLRRKAASGPNDLSAVIPIELFLPLISPQGEPVSAFSSMRMHNGAVIGDNGRPPSQGVDDLVATAESSRFGFVATATLPRKDVVASRADLTWLGSFASMALAAALIGFAYLLPKRQASNPIDEIERALKAGEFVPYYQPIVDIRSGQLRGAEVLVRWKKPDGTLVLPGAFIPLVESSGLILDLTRDLMKRVCVEAGAAIGRRPGLKISFNFAAKLFRDDSIVEEVRRVFAGTPIELTQVVLELTERDPIENLTETRRVVAALQGLGLRVAIDDVGTGHSGLSYMLKLGVDIIKIDKMFVDAIGTDRNSTTIVETLVDLAHNMRMDVVAEGVENFEQVMHLRELGIRSAQGYVFAPPLPGSAFLQLMEAIDPLPAVEVKVAGAARRYMTARTRFGAA